MTDLESSNNNNNEYDTECYICASTFPIPWKSDCNCIERIIHKECLQELIFKTGKLNCPVCLIPYRNANYVVTKKFNIKTNLTYSFCFCTSVSIITTCSIYTLVSYNTNKLGLAIDGFSLIAKCTSSF